MIHKGYKINILSNSKILKECSNNISINGNGGFVYYSEHYGVMDLFTLYNYSCHLSSKKIRLLDYSTVRIVGELI